MQLTALAHALQHDMYQVLMEGQRSATSQPVVLEEVWKWTTA